MEEGDRDARDPQALPPFREQRGARPRRGVRQRTGPERSGMKICRLDEIVPDTGVAALVGAEQVAVFRIDQKVYAIGNRDPFSGANVLARGNVGDLKGELVVASPVYKQHFSLVTGLCIEDPSVSVPVYRTRVEGGEIQILLTGESQCRT